MIARLDSVARTTRLAFTAAVALVGASSVSASAQSPAIALPNLNLPGLSGSQSGAPAAGSGQQQPPQVPWVKLCSTDATTKKNICQVREVVTDDTAQQLVASVTVQTTQNDPKMLLIVSVPPGVLLRPGMQIAIDTNQPMPLTYTICRANVCFADTDFTAENLKAIRAGKQLTIAAIVDSGQQVSMPISLAGFAKVYDGPATDPNATASSATAQGSLISQRQQAR